MIIKINLNADQVELIQSLLSKALLAPDFVVPQELKQFIRYVDGEIKYSLKKIMEGDNDE